MKMENALKTAALHIGATIAIFGTLTRLLGVSFGVSLIATMALALLIDYAMRCESYRATLVACLILWAFVSSLFVIIFPYHWLWPYKGEGSCGWCDNAYVVIVTGTLLAVPVIGGGLLRQVIHPSGSD